jgi:O-antigen ligase
LRTIEPPTRPDGTPPPTPRREGAVALVAGLLIAPLLVLTVLSRWGVLIAVAVALVVGIGLWVRRREVLFIQLVGFLIHFDGLGVGPIRMGRIVAAVAIGVLLWKLVVERWRPPAVPVRHWIFILVLTVWATATGAWSGETGGWFFALGLLGLGIAFYCVTALMVDSHALIQQYLRAFWWGGLWGSGAGVLALFLGTRSVGFGGDPNYFGLLQASMIPLTVYYRRNETDPLRRWWYTFALLFVFAGAAGAGSRSGIIGASVAIVGTMVTRPGISGVKRARTAVVAVIVAGLAFIVLFVANPHNLQRGFHDRGAGRLDFWAVSLDLIGNRPVLGHGFGQFRYDIVDGLAITPGVQQVSEQRDDVSAHNTYLDILGDLGIPGLLAWAAVLAVTFAGFLRPRWPHTKQLSTTLAVMMLPVMSSSMLLPLLNNKLMWSLIGLSAALQVPSWGARWSGFTRAAAPSTLPVPVTAAPAVPGATAPPPAGPGPTETVEWEGPVLARWDVRVSRRFRGFIVAGVVLGALVSSTVAAALPVRYVAAASFVVPKLDAPSGFRAIPIDRARIQMIHTLITSGAYAEQLRRLSGVDLDVREVRERLSVERPKYGAFMTLDYTDTDRDRTLAVLPYLTEALDATVLSGREFAEPTLEEEVRPILPGEERLYRGPLYLPVGQEATVAREPVRTVWVGFVGALVGGQVALAFVLIQQRRPRVNNDDDLLDVLRLPVWAHVGRAGRGHGATYDQYAQVATTLSSTVVDQEWPRHVVVTTPRDDRAARMLALGVAAAIAAAGRPTVLVDGQVDRPLLSRRLGGARRAGLVDAGERRVDIRDVTLPVRRWRMPSSVRRWAKSSDQLRFVPAGRGHGQAAEVWAAPLLTFGDDVTVITLAAPLADGRPSGHLLQSADAVVLAMVEGRTVTFDAEDAALVIRTFAAAPAGVVVLDV